MLLIDVWVALFIKLGFNLCDGNVLLVFNINK